MTQFRFQAATLSHGATVVPAAELAATGAPNDRSPMQWVYPRHPTKILVPIDLDGKAQSTVFEIAHRHPETKVFWYLDEAFISTTTTYHQLALRPTPGKHTLTLTDANGARLVQTFEIVARGK